MVNLFRNTIAVLAIPFLAGVALAFRGLSNGLKFVLGVVGLEFSWPPVLTDDVEAVEDEAIVRRTRIKRRSRRPRCGSR
jgi:hypothetical protein